MDGGALAGGMQEGGICDMSYVDFYAGPACTVYTRIQWPLEGRDKHFRARASADGEISDATRADSSRYQQDIPNTCKTHNQQILLVYNLFKLADTPGYYY